MLTKGLLKEKTTMLLSVLTDTLSPGFFQYHFVLRATNDLARPAT